MYRNQVYVERTCDIGIAGLTVLDIIIGMRGWFGNNVQGSVEIVISWHHEPTTHHVKFMPTHRRCAVCGVGTSAHAETKLVVVLLAEMST
jgi:hypothetical protein